jgi:hypothetical protein
MLTVNSKHTAGQRVRIGLGCDACPVAAGEWRIGAERVPDSSPWRRMRQQQDARIWASGSGAAAEQSTPSMHGRGCHATSCRETRTASYSPAAAPPPCIVRPHAVQTVAAASRQQEAPAARGRRSLVVRLLAPSLSAREAPPAARTSTRTMDHGGAARAPRALCGRGGRSSHGIGMGHGLCKLVCLHTYCSCMRAWRPQVQCRRRPAAPPCSAFHTLKMV